MRRSLPLLMGTLLLTTAALSQQADRFAYAITDAQPNTANWSSLRKLNLHTGEYSQVLLQGNDVNQVAYDAATRKQTAPMTDLRYGNLVNAAFGTGVAAMAYDARSNRLYYTPMFVDQLRYIDLKSMKVYYVTDHAFTGKPVKSSDQGNIVTRMVIASDGYGYAMTNDAMQLIRFSTSGKRAAITDLGAIADAQANKGVSIHNSCNSYGGDIIADDDGNLYVFSARNQVFKINIESKVATHLGTISGLPNGFTVNGAAVNADNQVLVASAVMANSYYTVDMKSLSASAYAMSGTVWQSSDLANSNLLISGNKKQAEPVELRNKPIVLSETNKIGLFPNPVTNNQFVIQFGQVDAGAYTIQVTDVMGRQVVQQVVNVNAEGQVQKIRLAASASKAVYMVKVLDANSRVAFSTKIVVQ